MNKNLEIVAEIINDSVIKLEKLNTELLQFNCVFEKNVMQASGIEIKTKRLEEVIDSWNKIFDNQKQQILKLQSQKTKTEIFYKITILGLVVIILILIFKLK